MQKEMALIRDLLIFIAVMFALCIVLIVVISMLSNDNPLKRILTALSYRIGATLAAGMIVGMLSGLPNGVSTLYETSARSCSVCALAKGHNGSALLPQRRSAGR